MNKASRPLLSIVIPTKNRLKYAVYCLRSLAMINSSKVEFIISDNSDSDELKHEIKKLNNNSRFKYNYTSKTLSQAENCDLGVNYATGEYVTLIGDDDTVNPEIVELTEWGLANNLESLVPSNKVHYFWPDYFHKYSEKEFSGKLRIKKYKCEITTHNVDNALINFLDDGCQTIVDKIDLPKLYYGIVKKSCLQKIKNISGCYFPGVSPDVAVATALAYVIKKVTSIDYPIFLPGSSGLSCAGAGARKEHWGSLEKQKHLTKKYVENWPYFIPKYWSVQTVWSASTISAMYSTKNVKYLKYFNYGKLYAWLFVFNLNYFGKNVQTYSKNYLKINSNSAKVLRDLLKNIFLLFSKRIIILFQNYIFKNAKTKYVYYNKIQTIEQALLVLQNHIQKSNVSLRDILKI